MSTKATEIDITDVSYAEKPFPSGEPETQLSLVDGDDSNVRHGGHLEMIAKTFEVSLDVSNEQLIAEGAKATSKSLTYQTLAGVYFATAKERCNHGEFGKLLEEIGIPRQRANEDISLASWVAQLPPELLDKALVLPKKAKLLLAKADPEVMTLVLKDSNLSKIKNIRNKSNLIELADALSQSSEINDQLVAENESLQRELKAVKDREAAHIGGSEYHPDVVKLRKESAILADQAIAGVASIRNYLTTVMQLEETQDEFGKNYAGAVFPAMAHMATVIKTYTDTFNEMRETYGINIEEIAGNLTVYDKVELDLIESASLTMLSAEQGSAIARVEAMIAKGEMKRGRGRPAKS